MMKVYVLREIIEPEDFEVVGVYATLERAKDINNMRLDNMSQERKQNAINGDWEEDRGELRITIYPGSMWYVIREMELIE